MSKKVDLSFDIFTGKLLIGSVSYSITKTFKSVYIWSAIFIGILIMTVSSLESLQYFISIGIFLAVIGTFFYYQNQYASSLLFNFAKANKLNTKLASDYNIPPSFHQANPLNNSAVTYIDPIVEIPVSNKLWELGIIDYSGRGKYVIFKARLNKHYPEIVIDNLKIRGIPLRPKGLESTKLEGPFNNKFTVYFRRNEQSRVLSLLDPVFMEILLDNFLFSDIEIISKDIYVIAYQDILVKDKLQSAVSSLGKLNKIIA